MGITRTQLINKVKRRLGAPMVKVELCDEQIIDNIDYARQKYLKWAVGNATQETYFTVMLQAGKRFYDLPAGVLEVVQYMDDPIKSGGINTLFTIDNFLFTGGYFGNMFMGGYDIVSYHLVMDFLTTLSKYRATPYNWKYHRSTNQLEINPVPAAGSSPKSVIIPNPDTGIPETFYVDSPGWVLLKTYMIQGSTLPSYTPDWRDILKEKKTIVEERGLSAADISNRYFQLEHTPYNNTEQDDNSDSNLPDDIILSGEGRVLQQDVDWWIHPRNRRLIQWGDRMAEYIAQTEAVPFGISISYPVVYNSEYYPDEWNKVTSTSNEVEKFTITDNILNSGSLKLNRKIWNNNVSMTVNGYAKQLGVDYIVDPYDGSVLRWKDKEYGLINQIDDVIIVNYVSVVSMKPSNAGSDVQTIVKQYNTKIENLVVDSNNVATKSIMLADIVSVGDGMKLVVNGSNRVFGVDYTIAGDRKTISWNMPNTTIDVSVGDPIIATYSSAVPIITEVEEDLYESDWIFDYVTALSKISLGMIRRKFESFSSMGNSGISLDGGDLISEGKEEKENLEETLRLEETWEGSPIIVG